MTEPTAQQHRPATHGSRTLTVNPTRTSPHDSATESASDSREGTPSSIGVLRLRGGPVRRNHVAWSSETIDNEGMGKKKSKICCIYHKPRKFDESSSESDDSCDDDGDSCCYGSSGPRSGGQRTRPSGGGSHVEDEASDSSSDGGAGDGSARPSRPNKMRRKPKHQHKPQMNKYDVQPTGGSATGAS